MLRVLHMYETRRLCWPWPQMLQRTDVRHDAETVVGRVELHEGAQRVELGRQALELVAGHVQAAEAARERELGGQAPQAVVVRLEHT